MRSSLLAILVITVLLAGSAPAFPRAPGDEPPEAGAAEDEAPPAEGDEGETEEPRTVDLVIQGEEPDRWHLDAGGGWNEHDGLFGRLALRTTNFLGRGEAFGATVELGDEHELYELEWGTPFLFGRRQSLGVRLTKDASDHPVAGGADFGRRRAGGTLTWGRRFGAHRSVEVAYRFADVAETETLVTGSGETVQRRSDYDLSSLRPRWVYDSLDDRLNPLQGLRLSASAEWAGGALGGDAELIKPEVGLAWFRPLGRSPVRSTLGVRSRLGWLEASGQVFPQQRFFSGGEDSVRGFRRRSIAVTDDDGAPAVDALGFPLGGERLAELNLELHLLLAERFRLVLFADAGGVASRGQSLDAGLRASAGAELRVSLKKLPIPLRLIWAENLDPLPGDRFDRFSFSLGIRF